MRLAATGQWNQPPSAQEFSKGQMMNWPEDVGSYQADAYNNPGRRRVKVTNDTIVDACSR
jgi:hypothetical protein